MKLKHLFAVNIFFAIFFGVTCVFFAGWLIRLYGLVPDTASLIIQLGDAINTRGWSNPVLYGLLALGYAYFLFIKQNRL